MKKASIIGILCFAILVGCQSSNMLPQASPTATPQRKETVNNPKIIVYKSDRVLYIYDGDELIASMDIALGPSPEGHKLREGDGKTPEGEYEICYRNDRSKFYLSLGLNYPNQEDATKGFEDGVISQAQYNAIKKAHEFGQPPLWNTALGGEIMIHGHGTRGDWTAGCIAVEDVDMDYIWQSCPNGTPVIIKP